MRRFPWFLPLCLIVIFTLLRYEHITALGSVESALVKSESGLKGYATLAPQGVTGVELSRGDYQPFTAITTTQFTSKLVTNSTSTSTITATYIPTPTLTATTSGTPATVSLNLPRLEAKWNPPPQASTAPGDTFALNLTGSDTSGAPVISEWNKTVKPGEPFTISGDSFTSLSNESALTDTKVWLWGAGMTSPIQLLIEANPAFSDNSEKVSNCVGCLSYQALSTQGRLSISSDKILNTRIPPSLPFGMYLVWVQNQKGISKPIPLNRTQPLWIGPLGNQAAPGKKKRVFGKNLSSQHGESKSFIYALPKTGGRLIPLKVTSVEPYAIEFVAPTNIGKYTIYVHNGHGGRFGWGEGLNLIVAKPRVRDARSVSIKPSGGDDTQILQSAIELMAGKAGGTVKLVPGIYNVSTLMLREGVRLLGEGMNQTKITSKFMPDGLEAFIRVGGNNVTIENLTIHLSSEGGQPRYGPLKPFGAGLTNLKVLSSRFSRDIPGVFTSAGLDSYQLTKMEVANSVLEFDINLSKDSWTHDNLLFGSLMGPPRGNGGAEAATFIAANRVVFERNHIETRDWPVGKNGSRNYLDFMTTDELKSRLWSKRMINSWCGWYSVENWYIGHNTSKDVAVDDNKGEMILLHGAPSTWYAQIASAKNKTLTIRRDGRVYGISKHYPQWSEPMQPATSIPDNLISGKVTDGHVVIINGTGVGQARRIVSKTSDSITVDKPWKIPPRKDSVITISFLYVNPIVYKNQMNGFPINYVLTGHSASTGTAFDGNVWGGVSEGNISRRTAAARTIGGSSTAPSYWTVMRDEQAFDLLYYDSLALLVWPWKNPGVGVELLGSRYLNTKLH